MIKNNVMAGGIPFTIYMDHWTQVTDTLPLILFMTGNDTHQHFIYNRSHHIHPWLKKTGQVVTGTCLLKASNILLYYFVSIKSLLSTTLLQ